MEKKEKEIAVWNLQVPKPLDEALDRFIISNFHVAKTEYIREAVREKLERAESDIRNSQSSLIRLVIVLVWIALLYDRLLANPFLAILLALGVLVILFGGRIRFGPVRIDHETTGTDSLQQRCQQFLQPRS